MRDALDILINKTAKVIANLQAFSLQWKGNNLSCLAPVRVGTRD